MENLICSKTGLLFKAKSRRSKNHPEVSTILSQANKDGVYRKVKDACEIVKEQEMPEQAALDFLKSVLIEKSEDKLEAIFEEKRKWKEFWKNRSDDRLDQIEEDEEDVDIKDRKEYYSKFIEQYGGNFE